MLTGFLGKQATGNSDLGIVLASPISGETVTVLRMFNAHFAVEDALQLRFVSSLIAGDRVPEQMSHLPCQLAIRLTLEPLATLYLGTLNAGATNESFVGTFQSKDSDFSNPTVPNQQPLYYSESD